MSLRSHLRHSSSGRDAALGRLRTINRSIIAGSVALTAIFADTAANTFAGGTPHHAKQAAARKHSHATQTTKEQGPPLAPPAEAPQSAQTTPEPEPERTPTQEPSAPEAEASAPAAPQVEQQTEPQAEQPVEQAPEVAPEREEAPVVSGAS